MSREASNHKRVILDKGIKELDFWSIIPIFRQAAIDQEFTGFDIDKELTNIHRDDYYRLRELISKYVKWEDLGLA